MRKYVYAAVWGDISDERVESLCKDVVQNDPLEVLENGSRIYISKLEHYRNTEADNNSRSLDILIDVDHLQLSIAIQKEVMSGEWGNKALADMIAYAIIDAMEEQENCNYDKQTALNIAHSILDYCEQVYKDQHKPKPLSEENHPFNISEYDREESQNEEIEDYIEKCKSKASEFIPYE